MKSGMKAAIHLQYSQDLVDSIKESIEATQKLHDLIKEGFNRERRRLLSKQSLKVLEWNMAHGYNGDDFVKNMYSIVFTGRAYKIPRIVKRLFKSKLA
jgi:hypothetical protein